MPDDADLARRDPGVPGLGLLLDSQAFGARFRECFVSRDRGEPTTTYVRYKPGTSCLVAYRIAVDGIEVDVYAKAYERSEHAKIRKTRTRADRLTAGNPMTAVWEDQSVTVSCFPSDNRMRSLDQLADADSRRRFFQKLLPKYPHLWDAAIERLRYKPERRYVARLSTASGPAAVLKCYTDDAYNAAKRGAKAFSSGHSTYLAKRLGQSDRHRVLAFEWLPGNLLGTLIREGSEPLESVAKVGAMLADLHSQTPTTLKRRTRQMEAASLGAVVAGLSRLCPWLSDRAHRLADHFATFLANRPHGDRPIHGDFYASQVIVSDRGTAIIDFDEAAVGDPRQDLGTFLAHLHRDAISGRLNESRIDEVRGVLVDGYRSAAGSGHLSAIDLFTAIALLRLAPHPFRQREPNWTQRIEGIVERVETLAQLPNAPSSIRRGSTHQGVSISGSCLVTGDPQLCCVVDALDPRQIERRLNAHCPDLRAGNGDLKVRAIRVVRQKPRRRCLIEYDVQVERSSAPPETLTLIGKVRAKGADTATFRFVTALHHAGFDAQSPHEVCIPEPVGIVPDLKMWLQKKVPGRPATDLIAGADGVALAIRIAEAIHELHQTEVSPSRTHTMADELRILHDRLQRVAATKPEWSARLARVLAGCDRLARGAPRPALRAIHRDFYPDHVMVDGPRLWLLDFDLHCQGDPALDIGNFQGHLVEQSLRCFGRPDALADQETALTERFAQLAGKESQISARIYATLTLVRHIFLSTQHPQRRELTGAILELCEERLRSSRAP